MITEPLILGQTSCLSPGRCGPTWRFWALGLLLTVLAFLIDKPLTGWMLLEKIPLHGDMKRELGMLEQYGQWTCTILILLTVRLLDRDGWWRTLGMAAGCLATVLACYLLKGALGRTRPDVLSDGSWLFCGPIKGLLGGSRYQSFPSAHTTGAFALSAALAWYFPAARWLFWSLAALTGLLRIYHHAHFLSDVIAGAFLAIGTTRWTLWKWNHNLDRTRNNHETHETGTRKRDHEKEDTEMGNN